MNQVKTTAYELTSLLTRPSTSSEFLKILQDWLSSALPEGTRSRQSQDDELSLEPSERSYRHPATDGSSPPSAALLKGLLHALTASKGWLVLIAVTALWGWWNGKLLLSTGGGLLAMVFVYRLQEWDWQRWSSEWQRFLRGPNRQLALAIVSGGLVSVGTYTALSLWTDGESPWVAASLLLQNGALLAVLGLLAWQAMRDSAVPDPRGLDPLLEDLTHPDPVKRLIAVRQISQLAAKPKSRRPRPSTPQVGESEPLPGMTRSQVADCFRLMLSREPEVLVRNALLDGLQALDRRQSLNPASSPTVAIAQSSAIATQPKSAKSNVTVAYYLDERDA